jgi:hypothetical protein
VSVDAAPSQDAAREESESESEDDRSRAVAREKKRKGKIGVYGGGKRAK